VIEFLQDHPFAYTQGLYNESTKAIFEGVFPRDVIVNAEGRIVYDKVGGHPDRFKKLDKVIVQMKGY
jgi:hypothetical protein